MADNIANMAFIVGDVNKSIGQVGREVYLVKVKTRGLESQCIPYRQRVVENRSRLGFLGGEEGTAC